MFWGCFKRTFLFLLNIYSAVLFLLFFSMFPDPTADMENGVESSKRERERREKTNSGDGAWVKRRMIRILISEKIVTFTQENLHILLKIISRSLSCLSMRQYLSLSFLIYSLLSSLPLSHLAQFNLVHNSIFLSYTLNCRSVLFRVCC